VRIVWLARAVADRDTIVAYIARDSPRAALDQGDRIQAGVDRLADNPQAGRRGRHAGTREKVVPRTPYIVVYRLSTSDTVEVLRVLHGAQQWPPVER
jgi:toxin ParE1/3/4